MIRTLNSLRFILILMIVISHSTLPISQDLINYLGEFPVAIFFVISGFVLSLSKGEKLQKEVSVIISAFASYRIYFLNDMEKEIHIKNSNSSYPSLLLSSQHG